MIMALSEAAVKKFSKDKTVTLALDYQNKFDSRLTSIRNEIYYLKKTWHSSVCSWASQFGFKRKNDQFRASVLE